MTSTGASTVVWSRADLLVFPILILAVALRVATSGYSLWFDEIAAVTLAHQPLELLWSGWMAREANPPLYYTLLKGWMLVFGQGDAAVQSLSTVIGIAGIIGAWWLARRIGGSLAGLIAALLLAASTLHVDLSQEVRGYILAQTAALFGCVAMTAYLERPRLGPLLCYVLAASVALYSHTTMVVFVALANLAMLWLLRRDRPALLRWLAANAAVALLWSWWAWISLGQAGSGGAAFSWIPRPDMVTALKMTAVIYLPLYFAGAKVAFIPVLALAALIGLAWFAARDRRPVIALLATLAIGAPVLLWALSQALPVFLPRTLAWAGGPVVVLVAIAIVRLPSRAARSGLVLLLLALQIGVMLRWFPVREIEAWPQQIATIARLDPHAVVMVQGDAAAVAARHYLAANGPGLRLVIVERPAGGPDHWADGLVSAPRVDAAGARAMLVQRGRLFTLAREEYDPGKLLGPVGIGQPLPGPIPEQRPSLALWRARPAATR